MYFMIDQYVDYLAMFINYEGVKAVQEADKNSVSDAEGFEITRVNKDFKEKKNKILKGESIRVNQEPNLDIKKKMEQIKKRISDAREGFIEVDESGNEIFTEGRFKNA